jgi:glutathione S-transferase
MTRHERKATIIGTPISPYVRKVLAVCALKNVEIEIDPIPPFFADDAFTAISPLRRIPVYRDAQVTLADSSVICQYLEDRYPTPSIYPADIAVRADARWLEEFADSRMGDVFIWRIFNGAVIGPAIFGRPRDKEAIARVVSTELTEVMTYLEARAPASGFFLGDLSIADISVIAFFANLNWSRIEIGNQWPKMHAWIARMRAMEIFANLERAGATLLRTPMPDLRSAAIALGFKVTDQSHFTPTPRIGPMTVLS